MEVWASQARQWYRIRLPMKEMQVQSLGQGELLEKEMATHSLILLQEIPWIEEPGGVQSKGFQSQTQLSEWARTHAHGLESEVLIQQHYCPPKKRLLGFLGGTGGKEPACQARRHKGHRFDPWVRKIPWSRKCQPTPVFLPGESHGQRSLSIKSHRVQHS